MEKVYEFKQATKNTVTLREDSITLRPHGLINAINMGFARGEKTILFADIAAIQFKKPRFTNGYIQFAYNGSVESKDKSIFGPVKDENTIMFGLKELDMATEIYEFIEKRRAELKRGTVFVQTVQQVDATDEIRKYKALLDDGIITESEFNEKKKQLLGV